MPAFGSPGIPTPCIGVCRLDPGRGWCIGCRRSLGEIARWSSLTDAEREEIMRQLPGRAEPGLPISEVSP